MCRRSKGKWFGGLSSEGRSGAFPAPHWFKSVRMTATATFYTHFGFAIAADGRQSWGHKPSRDLAVRNDESDNVQKIFEISERRTALAYILRGDIASRDRAFDFQRDIRGELATFRGQEFSTCRQFVEDLSRNLQHRIEVAIHDRRIKEENPAPEITFVGYFKGDPCWFEVQFYRTYDSRSNKLFAVRPTDFYPGFCFVSGSAIVRDLISAGDPRFAGRFCDPWVIGDNTSLQQAVHFSQGYIEACKSQLALQIDPDCDGIGGHVHAATITPENGFKWVVPPITAVSHS